MDSHALPLKIDCYHHCLLETEKENVLNALKSRYINILYATPESLLQIKDQMVEVVNFNSMDIENQNDPISESVNGFHHNGMHVNDMDHTDFFESHSSIEDDSMDMTKTPNITHIVFDECHLIAETTILYRPEYCYELQYLISEISNLSSYKDKPQIIALTASLTKSDRHVVVRKMGIASDEIHQFVSTDWNRPNLQLEINKTLNVNDSFKFDDEYSTPSIIYNQTRRGVDKTTTKLIVDEIEKCEESHGYQPKVVEAYHAGCNRRERRELQSRFYENKSDILVSTNAFGLGVNKNDVASIIHLGIPPNIQRYYQETGRAGRNHHTQTIHHCHCYYDRGSLLTNDFILTRSLFEPLGPGFDGEKLLEQIETNLLYFYQMLQYLVQYRETTVLTYQVVSDFMFENFEYVFGHNPRNYSKSGKLKAILYCSEDVLVDIGYYIAILMQMGYLIPTQQEYFDIFIPDNLNEILSENDAIQQEIDEILAWFVEDYLMKHDEFEMNQWNTMFVADIQSKWEKYKSLQIEENKNKNIKNKDQGDMLRLKKIESLLEIIRMRYDKRFGHENIKMFDFEKDLKEIGFELEDDDNRNFEIGNMNDLIEWDNDIKRQRDKWLYFCNWLTQHSETKKISNHEINELFQKYFNEQ